MAIIDEIRRTVALQLGVPDPADTDRIVEDLGADSVDVVTLIAAAEDRYSLILDDAVIAAISTVADLASAIEDNLATGKG